MPRRPTPVSPNRQGLSPARVSRPRRPAGVATAVALTALLLGCSAVDGGEGGTGAGEPPAVRQGALLVPVVPVGGDLPGRGQADRQSEERALQQIDEIATTSAGGVWLTADLRWLCPDPTCDPAPLVPLVDRATDHGLRVYLHVNSTTTWLDSSDRWRGPVGADAQAWAGLFAQFVAEFGTRVAGYEVWNEPNNVEFWTQGPDPRAYAALLREVWRAVQDVDPDAQIIGGALSNNDLGYARQLSEALRDLGGDADNGFFYDQLGVHPYTGDATSGFDPRLPVGSADRVGDFGLRDLTFRGVERLREQVTEDEGIERQVVIGEFGYDMQPGRFYHVPEPLRSRYLAEAVLITGEWEWLEGFTVYDYSGDPDDGFSVVGTPSEQAVYDAAASLQ